MTVSSIAGATPTLVGSTGSVGQKTQRALWTQVGQDLSSNNLKGAQTAFATLAKNYEANLAAGKAQPPGTGPISTDIEQLGSALKSGDLTSAQTAFTTLQQAVASAVGGQPTPDGSSAAQSSSKVDVLA